MSTDPEDMTDEQLHHKLKDDNDARSLALTKRTDGQLDLSHAFDGLRFSVYLKHVCLDLGILDRADLDFEGQRSEELDKVEADVVAREKAMAVVREHQTNGPVRSTLMSSGKMPPGLKIIQP